MQGREHGHAHKEGEDPLRRKREGEAIRRLPGGNEERVRKGAEVQQDAVEGDDAHALERVSIHHITRHHGVAHLDAGRKQEEGDLANDPMVCFVDADAPDDQPDGAEGRGGVCQPQSHLGDAHPVIAGGEFEDDGVGEAAGAEYLAKQGAEQKAKEEEALDLRGVRDVGGREHGDDGEDPPVPGEGIHEDGNDDDRVFEGKHEAGKRVPGFRMAHAGDGFDVQEGEFGGAGNIDSDGAGSVYIDAAFLDVAAVGRGGGDGGVGEVSEHGVTWIERFGHEGYFEDE